MKKLRKPYVATFLAFLMLFISCSKNDSAAIEEDLQEISLETYVEKHIEISKELSNVFLSEENIDLEILENLPQSYNNEKEYREALIKAGVSNVDNIVFISNKLQTNTNNFLKNSTSLQKLSSAEVNEMILQEINKQYDYSYKSIEANKGTCEENYDNAISRCERNFAIATGFSAVAGLISGGTGFVLGMTAAMVQSALCKSDADKDLEECID